MWSVKCKVWRVECREPRRSGHGSMMTCNILQHGNCWLSLSYRFAFLRNCPLGHEPVICHQGTDNSADASEGLLYDTWYGGHPVPILLFHAHRMFADITYIPGHQNTLADVLSRFEEFPSFFGCFSPTGITVSQPKANWPSTFRVRLTWKISCCRIPIWILGLVCRLVEIRFIFWVFPPLLCLNSFLASPHDWSKMFQWRVFPRLVSHWTIFVHISLKGDWYGFSELTFAPAGKGSLRIHLGVCVLHLTHRHAFYYLFWIQ